MSVKLRTEHRLVFVSIKGGCRGSSESTLVKMPHCVAAQFMIYVLASSRCVRYAGYIHISKKRKNSDKYHKSSFFMHAVHHFMLKFIEILFFISCKPMKGDTAWQLCFVC